MGDTWEALTNILARTSQLVTENAGWDTSEKNNKHTFKNELIKAE